MFNRSKVWAFALLGAVFLAGAVAGWALDAWASGREGGRGRGGRGTGAMVAHLTRELDLTPAQQDSVRAIIERHRPAFEALWRESHLRYDSLKVRVRGEIATQLTPEQQAAYRRLLAEREHQHRRADSGKE